MRDSKASTENSKTSVGMNAADSNLVNRPKPELRTQNSGLRSFEPKPAGAGDQNASRWRAAASLRDAVVNVCSEPAKLAIESVARSRGLITNFSIRFSPGSLRSPGATTLSRAPHARSYFHPIVRRFAALTSGYYSVALCAHHYNLGQLHRLRSLKSIRFAFNIDSNSS